MSYYSDHHDVDADEGFGADFQVDAVMQMRPKAIQVSLVDTGSLKWVPISVIHPDSEVFDMDHDTGKLIIFEWWATKEGWL